MPQAAELPPAICQSLHTALEGPSITLYQSRALLVCFLPEAFYYNLIFYAHDTASPEY
jgi:hypothetical protein